MDLADLTRAYNALETSCDLNYCGRKALGLDLLLFTKTKSYFFFMPSLQCSQNSIWNMFLFCKSSPKHRCRYSEQISSYFPIRNASQPISMPHPRVTGGAMKSPAISLANLSQHLPRISQEGDYAFSLIICLKVMRQDGDSSDKVPVHNFLKSRPTVRNDSIWQAMCWKYLWLFQEGLELEYLWTPWVIFKKNLHLDNPT